MKSAPKRTHGENHLKELVLTNREWCFAVFTHKYFPAVKMFTAHDVAVVIFMRDRHALVMKRPRHPVDDIRAVLSAVFDQIIKGDGLDFVKGVPHNFSSHVQPVPAPK